MRGAGPGRRALADTPRPRIVGTWPRGWLLSSWPMPGLIHGAKRL